MPHYKVKMIGDGKSIATGKCVFTKTEYKTSPFRTVDYKEWKRSGQPIQKTGLISLSSEDREFLISGTSPKFWESVNDDT